LKEINVKLEVFEGPMELLYHLIEKNEIDIYDIPIAELADQYIDYIQKFPYDMDSMSSFLVMASSLLEIKSKLLLPSLKAEEDEETDPREELVKRLLEYKRFKEISEVLKNRFLSEGNLIFKETDEEIKNLMGLKSIDTEEILSGVSMDTLYRIFEDVLNRKELKVDKIRSSFGSIKRDSFTIEEKIQAIQNMLHKKRKFEFKEIFQDDTEKMEVVVTFLALLELIKQKEVKVNQDKTFDKIFISVY